MNFSEKSEVIHSLKDQAILLTEKYPAYKDLGESIRLALDEKAADSKLRIVFVGQYSSGKSSIISALTNDSTIKIDSDIATDKTDDFEWKSVIITDTPGISAGRLDHDQITHKKIQQADLLVYVVTYSLFDSILIEDFKRLSVDLNYKNKMLLVVNKMYSEEGDYDDLCRTYRSSLNIQIGESTLNQIPISFVSAGYALDEDEDFHSYSHMDDLTHKLDDLIKENQSLGRVESVGQIVATSIEGFLSELVLGSSSEEQKLLAKIEKVISRVKRDAQSSLDEEVSRVASIARSLGAECASDVGISDAIQQKIKDSGDELNRRSAECFKTLAERFSALDEELERELEALGDSNLAKHFFSGFESGQERAEVDGGVASVSGATDFAVARQISSILGKGGNQVAGLAIGANAGKGLLTAAGASGSTLHKAVLGVGKALGTKFQPWQAVNIAKNIGNFAKGLGAVASAIPLFIEVIDIVQEEKRDKQLLDARRQVRGEFQDAGTKIIKHMETTGGAYIEDKYGALIQEISAMRRARINEAENLEEGARKLKEVSDNLRAIL